MLLISFTDIPNLRAWPIVKSLCDDCILKSFKIFMGVVFIIMSELSISLGTSIYLIIEKFFFLSSSLILAAVRVHLSK